MRLRPCYTAAMADVLRSGALESLGFRHGFSLRTGGVSEGDFTSLNLGRAIGDAPEAVAENHRRFAAAVGYPGGALFEVSQVHGADVRVVEAGLEVEGLRALSADALVADRPGVAVGIRTADCLGVLLASPDTGAVAAVHAGWRGTVAGVVGTAVAKLAQRGTAPDSLHAAILPHIGVCCFEVGADVADEIAAASDASDVVVVGDAQPHVDLAAVVVAQLAAAGVATARIDRVAGCTCCQPERFYSHRRDGQRSGRHVAAIVAR